ncbi:UNVERIFIED_CONTAM: hypothetical protein GTU68_043679 [Idotea baltica]|nr:hypothetical protein [Idotea baltica]
MHYGMHKLTSFLERILKPCMKDMCFIL